MTRALFISPHLDDVAFSCGGLVARASALGEQPLIVTVFAAAPDSTAGLPGLDRAHAAWGMAGLSPRQVIERRREEDQAASAVLDAHSRFLEYADAAVKGWDRSKHEVVVALPGQGPVAEQLAAFCPVRDLNYSSVAISIEGGAGAQLGELERCRRLLEEERPALVFVSNPAPTLALACRLAGIPIVCHLKLCFWLGPEDAKDELARESMLPSYDLTIANSRGHEEGLRRLAQPPPGRLTWVSDGIALDEFTRSSTSKEEARRTLGLPERGKLVLLVGNVGPHKRTVRAANVLAQLRTECPDTYIVVVGAERGSPGYQAEVEERAAEFGVTDRLIFLGHREDMHTVYTAGDALLHLGLIESFGLVMAEAMSMELPVVAVASGGAIELVEDGVTGRLVSPPGRPAELAHALAEILSDPERQRSMGLAGRKRAEQHFDVRFYVSRLEQLCAGFLEGCREDCSDAGPVS